MTLIPVRSSWIVELDVVRPLGTKTRRIGREYQREAIRERVAATGTTRRQPTAITDRAGRTMTSGHVELRIRIDRREGR